LEKKPDSDVLWDAAEAGWQEIWDPEGVCRLAGSVHLSIGGYPCSAEGHNKCISNVIYRRTSISGTKKAQITFPLRHFLPLKVIK
jgi:hypothetical protein